MQKLQSPNKYEESKLKPVTVTNNFFIVLHKLGLFNDVTLAEATFYLFKIL